MEWMPATHLISVDLPAPLSPTSAITSPSRTSKSTPRSACTDPKLLWTSRSSSAVVAGVVAMSAVLYHGRGATRERPGREEVQLQYWAYCPVQTSLFFKAPSSNSSV